MIAARWIRVEEKSRSALRATVTGFARAQASRALPTVLWAQLDEESFLCALVAPLKFAPGRVRRWPAWALAPLIAAYRVFGRRAYLEGNAICVGGATVASCEARTVGDCAVVLVSFEPADRQFMVAIRHCIEAQQGWQFDNAWPTDAERAAIGDALMLEALGAPS